MNRTPQFFRRIFVFGGSAIMMIMAALPLQASIVTGLTDTMTNQNIGSASNHTFSFVTRTGAAEGATITVSFASPFDTGTIDLGDIDLAVGGVDRTLAASCAGTEQAGVTIALDVVTFTICTGDGGAITANSTVTIEIGTNATSQAASDARITNPSTLGSYSIVIGGSFGDRGALAVAIASPGGVTILGSVGGVPGGGSPGGGGTGDTAPPVISNVQVVDITETSARVTWTTSEAANSFVDYGVTTSYEMGTESRTPLVTSQSIPLAGLATGTAYHFRARSRDAASNEGATGDLTFNTLPPPDIASPVISDVQVLNITGTSVTIAWATNEPATSGVDYGTTTSYEIGTVQDNVLVLDHAVNLTNLSPETTYQFRVRSADGSGNEAFSENLNFRTLDITPPTISDLEIIDITQGTARAEWLTNEAGTSAIRYGLTTDYEIGTITSPAPTTSHSLPITGLLPNTRYHVQAESVDAAGNAGVSADAIFTTLPDTRAPANVSNFVASASAPGEVRLTWTNPPDDDFAGVRIVRRADRFPGGPTDGTTIFDARGVTTFDRGLTAGVTYRYGAYAYDTSGNFASGALADATIPAFCGDNLCTVGETSASCPADCGAPVVSVCGNTICEAGETRDNCAQDCPAPPPPLPTAFCGNFICEEGESTANCPVDCPFLPGAFCGNLFCEAPETTESCPSDCPVIPVPPRTVGEAERLTLSDLELVVANQQIELTRRDGTFEVLQGTVLWVRIRTDAFLRDPSEIRFLAGTGAYMLGRTDDHFETAIVTPSALQSTPAVISVLYPDGLSDRLDFTLDVLPWGRVATELPGVRTGLSLVLVTLLDETGGVWDAEPFGEANPTRNRADGTFAWYVPNGFYRLLANRDGYRGEELRLTVTNAIVNPEVILIALPPLPLQTLQGIVTGPGTVLEKISQTGELIGETVGYGYEVLRTEVLDNPLVEKVAETVAAPTLTTLTVVGAGAAATSTLGLLNLLNFARFLFTQPAVLLNRRKRKAWGVVYNAITKIPIDLAVVRLLDGVGGRLLQSRVTDRDGRYFFITQPGTYKIEVRKVEFHFPSEYLAGKKTDVFFVDVYHGESVNVTERDATVAPNIPLDPEVRERPPARVIRTLIVRRISQAVAIASPIMAAAVVIITPSLFTAGLFVAQVAIYTALTYLVRTKKPKGWGIVYDARTRRPLRHAIVRIFEPVYGKLLEMQVTDAQGRYSFLVGPNLYKVASEKEGYAMRATEIDYRAKKEPEVVTVELPLEPATEKEEWKPEPL